MKYAVGYFYNPGRDEYGNQSICHRHIIGLEKAEGKLPTKTAIWKKYDLQGKQVVDTKVGVYRFLRKDDIFIVTEESYLYNQTFVSE